MTDRELLEQILAKVTNIDERLTKVESDVSDIKLKVDSIDTKVDRNYDKTVEFYAAQQEHNTEISDTLDVVSGKLEIYADQTARNTIALKRYK